MSEPVIIDTKMHGHAGITGSFLVSGETTALVETGPRSSVRHVLDGLESAGIDSLDWIVVTHIHLDHAGAAGTLAARFPKARVAVHRLGAPHLVDPSKLWASAARIYGDDMHRLWGGIDPLDENRLQVLDDGDKLDLGGRVLQAVETPGHARHHHAYLDDRSGALFAGDALGVRLPGTGVIRPATPPPEFDLERAVASIERIKTLGAASLWFTHYGPDDMGAGGATPAETCDAAIEALIKWAGWVRSARAESADLERVHPRVEAAARAELEAELEAPALERLEQTTSYRMNAWGYLRYFDKLG